MTEDEDQEIAAALAKLAGQDAAAADDARAALEWIAGEQDLAFITQARIQNFCWYNLPVKWFVDLDEKVSITAALAHVLDLLQLPRYAAISSRVGAAGKPASRNSRGPTWTPRNLTCSVRRWPR